MDTHDTYEEMVALLRQNNQLLGEAVQLLRRQERRERWGAAARTVGFLLFLILPIILYYYIFNNVLGAMSGLVPSSTGEGGAFDLEELQQLLEVYQGGLERV